jgi:hypothetical protein
VANSHTWTGDVGKPSRLIKAGTVVSGTHPGKHHRPQSISTAAKQGSHQERHAFTNHTLANTPPPLIFPHYLVPETKLLLTYIAKAKYNIQENISWCKKGDYAGATIEENKTYFICTNTLLKGANANKYLNETVNHEAVHVIQGCIGMRPLGIPLAMMPLPPHKLADINRSVALTKRAWMRQNEHEAFWLEDKPKLILKYMKHFCF